MIRFHRKIWNESITDQTNAILVKDTSYVNLRSGVVLNLEGEEIVYTLESVYSVSLYVLWDEYVAARGNFYMNKSGSEFFRLVKQAEEIK